MLSKFEVLPTQFLQDCAAPGKRKEENHREYQISNVLIRISQKLTSSRTPLKKLMDSMEPIQPMLTKPLNLSSCLRQYEIKLLYD